METDFFQKGLLTDIEKQGVDFIYFVDISHLTDKQSKGYYDNENRKTPLPHKTIAGFNSTGFTC